MAKCHYEIEVETDNRLFAGTTDYIYVTLLGSKGKSERTQLKNHIINLTFGTTKTFTMKTTSCLGELLLVIVEKDQYLLFPENQWYCSQIKVKTPDGDVIRFPCYRWISNGDRVELRGGRAMKVFEETNAELVNQRQRELETKKSLYQWEIADEKLPDSVLVYDGKQLPAKHYYSYSKYFGLGLNKVKGLPERIAVWWYGSTSPWESIEQIRNLIWNRETEQSEYVREHWKDDDFFGYQFLNGTNPGVIERCSELPPNFPVTEEMVKPSLGGRSLKQEMEDGNIFLRDQKIMDGIQSREVDGERLTTTACFCLFYLNPDGKLKPIAIQLLQKPSEQNPIFLPSDPETDWLLAKIFVKNAEVIEHEAVGHLMNTHLLAEVFALATLRNLPAIHPLYKLLIPHFRYTLQINTLARKILLGPEGVLSKCSLGHEGLTELMRRALSEMKYISLCLPENIRERGLESIPNFYYRDDGLKLWDIINSFVEKIVKNYYPSDSEVQKDTELQDWIKEIFTHGFLRNKDSGFPATFNTVGEVIKFITMLIFRVSVQHAAVNNGQYDYYHWMPNGALLLRKSPPTTKGQSSQKTILETLPNIGETVQFETLFWILSDDYSDEVYLGKHPQELFDEPAPKKMMKKFKAELDELSGTIQERNDELPFSYPYLDPEQIESSVAI